MKYLGLASFFSFSKDDLSKTLALIITPFNQYFCQSDTIVACIDSMEIDLMIWILSLVPLIIQSNDMNATDFLGKLTGDFRWSQYPSSSRDFYSFCVSVTVFDISYFIYFSRISSHMLKFTHFCDKLCGKEKNSLLREK